MEAKSVFTFVILSPRLDMENLFVASQRVTSYSDASWKLVFGENEKKHFWIAKVVAEGVEKVLSLPTVFPNCCDKDDVLKVAPKLMKLLSFEDIVKDFTSIAVGSTVLLTESEDYLGTFILSECLHIQELKRV